MSEWNPRFVCYAKAHGRTPEQMLEHDAEQYPGGKMCGFILWSSEMLSRFYDLHGLKNGVWLERDLRRIPNGQAEYDKYLEQQTR